MPPPPPPAPPPPPSLTATKAAPARTQLLSEIHQGARLKKTVTNDRSAPLVGGKVNSPSAGSDSNSSAGQSAAAAPGKLAAPSGGIGALFAGGVPRKPSDVKNLKQASQNSAAHSNNNGGGVANAAHNSPAKMPAPLVPKPAPPPSLYGGAKPTLATASKPTISSTARNVTVKSGVVAQLQSNLQNNLNLESDQNKFSASSSSTSASHPPPPPPSAKLKPTLPAVPFSANKPSLQPNLAKPLLVKQDSVAQKPEGMRRPAAPPPPPPSVHSSVHHQPSQQHPPATPHRDRGPLPPPPPSSNTSLLSSSSSTTTSTLQHDSSSLRGTNFSAGGNAGAPSVPPPPPPRISSCMDSIEQRFHFVPISELPPPPKFVGFKKIYETAQQRKSTSAAH